MIDSNQKDWDDPSISRKSYRNDVNAYISWKGCGFLSNPTIYDVAKLSGVSTATISRAFSNPEQVRESTRRRVFETAEALHYYPNSIARAMARQRTDKIAFLICKKDATILDEFYARICESIMHCTNSLDYQLLISTEQEWHQTTQGKQIDGVLLGGNAGMDTIAELKNQNAAVVLINNRISGADLPCVISDEVGGMHQAVEHLYQKGHRSIALIAGRLCPYILGERYNAFLGAMNDFRLPVDPANIRMCEPTIEVATETALELLDRRDRPTAVIGANDVIAAGTYKAASRLGLRIPQDLAVIGVDDSTLCTVLEPELTSVHIDCHSMGELAVERLKALLHGETEEPRTTVVPTELRVRGST